MTETEIARKVERKYHFVILAVSVILSIKSPGIMLSIQICNKKSDSRKISFTIMTSFSAEFTTYYHLIVDGDFEIDAKKHKDPIGDVAQKVKEKVSKERKIQRIWQISRAPVQICTKHINVSCA